jgi:hypothetical protein
LRRDHAGLASDVSVGLEQPHPHFPVGPRGSAVSGRQIHWMFSDKFAALGFVFASTSLRAPCCLCISAWAFSHSARVATPLFGTHPSSGDGAHRVHHVGLCQVCSHSTHALSAETEVARPSRQERGEEAGLSCQSCHGLFSCLLSWFVRMSLRREILSAKGQRVNTRRETEENQRRTQVEIVVATVKSRRLILRPAPPDLL